MNTRTFLTSSILFSTSLLLMAVPAFAAAPTTMDMPQTAASITLATNPKTVTTGQELVVAITVNSANQPVNAIQANLHYPQATLTFEKIDTTKSVFPLQVEGTGTNGMVKIARGTTKPVTGAALTLATVTFKATGPASASDVTVDTASSAVMNSTTNKNLLPASKIQINTTMHTGGQAAASANAMAAQPQNEGFFAKILHFFKHLFGAK